MSNAFAEAARAVKIRKLVQHLDRLFIALGRCPLTEAADIAVMLRESVNEEQWKHHALQAGVNKPSASTVAMVIKEYEDRAAARACEAPMRRYGGTH